VSLYDDLAITTGQVVIAALSDSGGALTHRLVVGELLLVHALTVDQTPRQRRPDWDIHRGLIRAYTAEPSLARDGSDRSGRSFAVAVAVTRKPGDAMPRGCSCRSDVVGRGGVEPPTFRFSGVTSTLFTALVPRSDGGRRAPTVAAGCCRCCHRCCRTHGDRAYRCTRRFGDSVRSAQRSWVQTPCGGAAGSAEKAYCRSISRSAARP
jgi:hypothetical protein